MTPLEKWQRLNNPQCPADYGLTMNETELASIPGVSGKKLWVLNDAPQQ